MKSVKSFIKDKLCIEKQVSVGPVSIFLCDMMLSINLLGPDVVVEDPNGVKHTVGPSSTYGITVEPFAFHLMGRDGDICWSSPGWSLVDWAFSHDTNTENHNRNLAKLIQNAAETARQTLKNRSGLCEYEFQLGT